jgi:hypothetical protein
VDLVLPKDRQALGGDRQERLGDKLFAVECESDPGLSTRARSSPTVIKSAPWGSSPNHPNLFSMSHSSQG